MHSVFTEPARQLPVSGEYDVLVCGGGIAGIAAALAAARGGARTLLIEREFALGGLATLGLVTIYLPLCDGMGHQVSFGIAEELLRLSIARFPEARYPRPWLEGGTLEEKKKTRFQVQYNPHVFAADAETLLLGEGVELLYGTLAAGAAVEDGRVTHVVIENKSGRSALRVGRVVDATGDADLCRLAGADCAVFGQGNVLAAWYYRHTDAAGVQLKMLGYADVPDKYKTKEQAAASVARYGGLDAREISGMMTASRQSALRDLCALRETDPSAVPVTLPSIPQLRMTRRIVGAATPDDKPTHARVEDSIGMIGDWRHAGPVYELPYRCLWGEKIRNLITAGRIISVTDAMWDVTRVIPACAVTGQAAGAAAAMGPDFPDVDVPALQRRLSEAGVPLHWDELNKD